MKWLAFLLSLVLLGVAIPTPAQMTKGQAREEGKALGSAMRNDEQWIPRSDAQSAIVPGYQGTDLPQAQYYSDPDKLANDGNALKGASEVYQISTDANKTRQTFSTDEIKAVTANASAIENDPSTQLGGESISGGSGECQPLPAENAQITYDATCDTGVVVNSVPSETIYSCPPGWKLGGTSCSMTETIPASISYSCDAGWTLNGAQCAQTQPANVSAYSCPSGWTLKGSRCSRTLTQDAAHTGYNCPNGYALSGSTCTSTISEAATASFSCPAGYSLDGTNCTRTLMQPVIVTSSCPAGGALDGTDCVLTETYGATPANVCPQGGIFTDGLCKVLETATKVSTTDCSHISPSPYFASGNPIVLVRIGAPYCGYLVWPQYSPNKSCKKINGYAVVWQENSYSQTVMKACAYNPVTILQCPTGFVETGGQCQRMTDYTASTEYSCPGGGTLTGTTCTKETRYGATLSTSCPVDYTLSGSQCLKQETIPASVSYSCATGLTLNGATCTRTDALPGTPVYACLTDYSLSGITCTKSEDQAATPIYSCPIGFVLSGSQCTATVAAQPSYYCPADFTLSGQRCSQTHSQPATSHQICPKGANTKPDGSCYTEDPQSDCGTLESNPQCSWKSDNCLDENPTGDGCKMMEKLYRCPAPGGTVEQPPKYVCGDDVYCINGDCEAINREASSEFKDALTALHAIDTAGKDFDPDDMHVFPGTRDTCHKPIFGVVNCCAGKVSGLLPLGIGGAALAGAISGNVAALSGVATQFLTTFLCSTDEKMLDVKDRMGFCTFVGSYCSSSILGVCKTKRKAYCCFESKLSRILQEQGRPQINKPFGKPKNEQCEGFTVDEFSRLDLSVMDFTDVYSDFMDAAKLPDEVQTVADIQQKIQGYYELHAQ